MRYFKDGDTIWIEPFRAKAFPIIKDLVVDRSAFDHIITAGGYISARTGSAPEANATQIPKKDADAAMDAAACIGCGACVAACKNASAMLFVAAKAGHLNSLPQGQAEKKRRVIGMVQAMDEAGFGNCTNQYECEAACPKSISADFIAKLNRDYAVAVARESIGLCGITIGGIVGVRSTGTVEHSALIPKRAVHRPRSVSVTLTTRITWISRTIFLKLRRGCNCIHGVHRLERNTRNMALVTMAMLDVQILARGIRTSCKLQGMLNVSQFPCKVHSL